MNIETRRFGSITVDKDKIINFKEGLPGFPEENYFAVILNGEDEKSPISFLQSTANPDISFVIMDPFKIFTDYDFKLPETVQKSLDIKSIDQVIIYNMVTIPDDIREMTANLMAPIIINIEGKIGRQIILEDNKYHTKHYILRDRVNLAQEGGI